MFFLKSRLMLVRSAILAEEENYSNLNTDSRTYSQTDTQTSQTDRQTGQTDRQLQIHKTHSNVSTLENSLYSVPCFGYIFPAFTFSFCTN